MRCNGCGGEFDVLAGTLSYGKAALGNSEDSPAASSVNDSSRSANREGGATRDAVRADHHKTLCPRCQHVMKDILQSSNLSEHWHKYEWSLMGDAYTEAYDGTQESN